MVGETGGQIVEQIVGTNGWKVVGTMVGKLSEKRSENCNYEKEMKGKRTEKRSEKQLEIRSEKRWEKRLEIRSEKRTKKQGGFF